MAAALYSSGVAAFRATSFETAIDLFTQAIALDEAQAKFYDARANAFEKVGRLKDALGDARMVVKLAPTSHKGFLRAGKLFRIAEKYDHAEKMLLQGLSRVDDKNVKVHSELTTELELVREIRAKAEHSPLSHLPAEIFIDIISLAIERSSDYTASLTPRLKPPRPNTLLAALSVSRTWYQTISGAPRLWSTLRIDGEINSKTFKAKARGWALKSLGRSAKEELRRASEDGPGLNRLIITAAQEFSPTALQETLTNLQKVGALNSLRHFTISFVDGNRTVEAASRESKMTAETLTFLYSHLSTTLLSFTLCSRGRIYPDFETASFYFAFPSLHTLRLCGNTTSTSVAGIRGDFLSRYNVIKDLDGELEDRPPTKARHLTLGGAALVTDAPIRLIDFPLLEGLDLEAIGAASFWELLSAPDVKQYHAVVYGENHVVELPLPSVAEAWRRVESLRLGGAKRLAPRLLDEAASARLSFPHLTNLDLAFVSLSTSQLALFDSSNAPFLASLNLSSTTCSTFGASFALPTFAALKILNISHTLWVTDDTIRSLVALTPQLERLSAIGCVNLSGRPLMELVRFRMAPPPVVAEGGGGGVESKAQYSQLVEMRLDGCTKIETTAVDWLRKYVQSFKFTWLDPAEKGRKRARLQ
ncbi:Proteophosphoglycan 5 [Leucosporidium creatinivorum]|uniref:Proteophosphoglycan 5 n=1 Tax=Leucosporidium creatinivorum TaxID=106004 RepID=A0A1Y2G653_9BASI|nr:Proteophosphoglycan 5 [Leucosporidium creatinivorum]